jgi:hypothetical protein
MRRQAEKGLSIDREDREGFQSSAAHFPVENIIEDQ